MGVGLREGAPQRAGEISGLLYDRLRIFVSSLVAGDWLLFLMLNLVRSLIDMRGHLISRIWNLPVSARYSFKMMEYSSQQILSLYQFK